MYMSNRNKFPLPNRQPPKVPQGAAGLFLLGRLCHKAQRPRHAQTYYRLALKLDPTLWGAYEALCRLDPRLAGRAIAAAGACVLFGVGGMERTS